MFSLIKAIWQRGLRAMDIILHLGAHRCATTTFQAYLDQNRARLGGHGVAVWTPQVTRNGLFDGVICPPGEDSRHHIARIRDAQHQLDASQLIVSEENMIGAPRNNLKHTSLYPELTPRLQRFAEAFQGRVARLGLAIRSYESYWTSALSFAALRGEPLPDAAQRAALARQPRTWTDMVQDIRAMFPAVPLHVWTFEAFAGRPRRQFNMLSGRAEISHTLDHKVNWKNTSCNLGQMRRRLRSQGRLGEVAMLPRSGKWQPFNQLEKQYLAMRYADDLRTFRSGSDPMITFTENAAIKVQRRQNMQALPATDTGEYHDRHAKMG